MDATDTNPVLDTPRSLRVRLGLQQADVAREAPMSVRTVHEIESAGRVSVRSVNRYAHVLRIRGDGSITAGRILDAMDRERTLQKRANFFRKDKRR